MRYFLPVFLAYIAFAQYRLSRKQFEYSRYERRVLVFRAVHEFLATVNQGFRLKQAVVTKFYGDTAESHFLFGMEIPAYIDEIASKGAELAGLSQTLADPVEYIDLGEGESVEQSLSDDELTETRKQMEAIHTWFKVQMAIAREKFRPYLPI